MAWSATALTGKHQDPSFPTKIYPIEIGSAWQFLTAHEMFDLVREDLLSVERAIGIESAGSFDTLAPISKCLQQEGGERLRAALLLLCAQLAGGGDSRMAIQLGAVVEMMHAAALVHGDVIDVRQSCRGWASGSLLSANGTCVLAGDWLYLGAFRVALQESVFHLVIGAAQMMTMGQLNQINRIGCIEMTEADCIELADRNTACLFSVCGKLAAVTAGIEAQDGEKLSEFAWNVGMAFQLVDDLMDFVSSESTPAKHAGANLKAGKVKMPLVYALEEASVSERNLVASVLQDRGSDAASFANVLTLVDRSDGIQRTRARARQFAGRARQILAEFPDSAYRRALFTLIDRVTERGW